ncbi:hypothetical protein SAMN05444277_106177 [Parafilimonas terrae]|uniref:Uncharacterized protein n=1 Tax=Parafilimonas terrae TaxID=1465490 RepID=A0A1I5WHL2_9BACT|nr:hypothetical protein SAMN05444277_106177 [Parafilimonas terrae]
MVKLNVCIDKTRELVETSSRILIRQKIKKVLKTLYGLIL